MSQIFRKVYVEINALIDTNGKRRPLRIRWEDGRVFKVERLLSRSKAKSQKVGGGETRYTIQINGQETFIFEDEDGRWFVESKC